MQQNILMNEVEVLNALCRENLSAFTNKAFNIIEPSVDFEWNWHIDCIAEHLMAVYEHEIQNLIINMPPRSLKTHTTSVSFAAWCLGKNPALKLMLTSFKSSLAEKMTRNTRKVMRSDWYKDCFPETQISSELDRQYYFETTQFGQYFSSSMDSVTGEGCDIQISDDPLNPMEAVSDTVRNTTNETIRGTLFSRFNDPRRGRFILNMQRLHEADPSGELLADQETKYYHLKLPAIADRKYIYQIRGKKWEFEKGEYLFPSRFNEDVLNKARSRMTEYHFSGQYLQEPVPLGGNEFKPDWINYYPNGSVKPTNMNIYILCDPAGGDEINKKKKKTSDWTAFMVVGLAPDNNYYLLDMVRDRLNPTERINTLFILHRKWNALAGKPAKVGYEKYALMTDTHYIKEKMVQDTYHFTLVELGGTMQKEERIRRIIPDMQNGRWFFPDNLHYVDTEGRRFDLVNELVNSEMPNFPRAKFDDMLDALSRLYDDDLGRIFPKIQQSQVAAAYEETGSDNWEDF